MKSQISGISRLNNNLYLVVLVGSENIWKINVNNLSYNEII